MSQELVPVPPRHGEAGGADLIADLRRRILEQPTEAGLHFYLGCALFHQNHDLPGAIASFKKAIQCEATYLPAYKALWACFSLRGEHSEARVVLLDAYRRWPRDFDVLTAAAEVFYNEGRTRDARGLLKRARRCADDNLRLKIVQSRLARYGVGSEEEAWSMARRDCCRSSFQDLPVPLEQLSVRHQGVIVADHPVDVTLLPDIPAPVMADDMLIVPDASMSTFRGVVFSGAHQSRWHPGKLADRLTHASTPVYIAPHLFFAVHNRVWCANLHENPTSTKVVLARQDLRQCSFAAPLAYENIAVFPFRSGVYLFDTYEEKGGFIELQAQNETDEWRSPVICDDKLILLSRAGRLWVIDILGQRPIKEASLDLKGTCSAPCAVGTNVYFEFLDEAANARWVCAYSPVDDSIVREPLANELCSEDDLHLMFCPIQYRDSILISSDVEPMFYQVRRLADMLEILPLSLSVAVGHHRVVGVSHVFATVLGSHLVSKTEQGFYVVNLEDPGVSHVENLNSVMISQPLADSRRLYFLCAAGVECFSVVGQQAQREDKDA